MDRGERVAGCVVDRREDLCKGQVPSRERAESDGAASPRGADAIGRDASSSVAGDAGRHLKTSSLTLPFPRASSTNDRSV